MFRLIIPIVFVIAACQTFDAQENLDNQAYSNWLLRLAPYVNKKPDGANWKDRFDERLASHYLQKIEAQESELMYFLRKDTLTYFFYVNKDLSSLFEHYRGHGGRFQTNESGEIKFLEILYYTPRWTKQEVKDKGRALFKDMVVNGHVNQYIGQKNYIHIPNEDFYYNTSENRWDYTGNSSWGFLEDIRENRP